MIDQLPYEIGFEMTCNRCGFFQEFQVGSNWKLLIVEARNCGWRFWKVKRRIWDQYCPECMGESEDRKGDDDV